MGYLKSHPDAQGFFGPYGGADLPPVLVDHFAAIEKAYLTLSRSAGFIAELRHIRKHFQGRPTPVSYLGNLSADGGGAQIYAKREDLNHTGAHKLNHCMAEALLAKHMGKTKGWPKPVPGSTAWRWQRRRPISAWNAKSTWARSTSPRKPPMSPG